MQTNLFAGRVLVPPKFLGECRSMILLLAFATKITVSTSSVTCYSLVASFTSEPRVSLNAWRFLFPASLLAWLINQSDQVVCVVIVSLVFLEFTL
jgi:hypothetical protein